MAESLSEELEATLAEASDAIDIMLDNDAEEQTEITEEAEYELEDVLSFTEDAEDDLAAEIADEVVNKALINDSDIADIENGRNSSEAEGIDADAAAADPEVKAITKELVESGTLSEEQVKSLLEGEDEYEVVKDECGECGCDCEDPEFVATNRFIPDRSAHDDRDVLFDDDDFDDDDEEIVVYDDQDDDDGVVIELRKDEVHDKMFGNNDYVDFDDALEESFNAVEAYDEAAKKSRKNKAKKRKLDDDDYDDDNDEALEEAFKVVEAYDEAAKKSRKNKAKKRKLDDDDYDFDDDDDEAFEEAGDIIPDSALNFKHIDDFDYEEDDGADFDDDVHEVNSLFGQKYNFGSYSDRKTSKTLSDKVGFDFLDNLDPNAKAMVR